MRIKCRNAYKGPGRAGPEYTSASIIIIVIIIIIIKYTFQKC